MKIAWGPIAWFGGCLVLCYAPVMAALAREWGTNDDLAHAVFAPVLAGYVVWTKRGALAAAGGKGSGWGLALVLYAGVQCLAGGLIDSAFLPRTALFLSLVGTILYLRGAATVRVLAFPLLLLLLTIPPPWSYYKQATFQLQLLASRLTELSLDTLGYSVFREGNVLDLVGQRLSVVEACSGIRSLYSLLFLGVAYAYLLEPRQWARVLVAGAAAPAAVAANTGRIVVTAVVGGWNPQLGEGLYHAATGWILTLAGFALMVLAHVLVTGAVRVFGVNRRAKD